jgi:hypothetical protein
MHCVFDLFFQLAAMKEELECATAAIHQSEEKIRHLEMQLRDSNKKV